MNFKERSAEQAYRSALETLSREASEKVRGYLASVSGYDIGYVQQIVGMLIGIAYGTYRLHPDIDLERLRISEKKDQDGTAFALRVLREAVLAPVVDAASAMFPPQKGKLESYERFIRAACLMAADHLLDPLRFDLIPER